MPEATLAHAAPAAASILPFDDLCRMALEKGSVESLERLVALQERILDRNAAAEFFDAMAAFQAKCPPIPKSSTAEVKKDGRIIASYRYAELDTIARIINPILAPLGLSYSWDAKIDEKANLTCVCRVRHRAGHSQTAQFEAPIGGTSLMSDAQKGAATLTYAKRQALVSALGLTTGDDNDASPGDVATISEEEAANLSAFLDEVKGDRARFLSVFGVESLGDLPKADLPRAIQMLEVKRKSGR